MIDPDNEAQEGIDAEEAAAAEFADNETESEDGDVNEDDEMEYLKELERIDRLIKATEEEYADKKKEFNDKLKALKNQRNDTLDEIEKFRLGERGLPYDKND